MKMNVTLKFYESNDGIHSMRDSEIMAMLNRADHEGVLDYIFFGDGTYTKEMFLFKVKFHPGNLFFSIHWEDWPVGFGLMDNMRWRKADGHFCFYRKFWGKPELVEIAKETYRQLFERFSVMIGVVPITNKFAVRFCKKAGMKEMCMIPGYFHDGENSVDGVQFIAREI